MQCLWDSEDESCLPMISDVERRLKGQVAMEGALMIPMIAPRDQLQSRLPPWLVIRKSDGSRVRRVVVIVLRMTLSQMHLYRVRRGHIRIITALLFS